MKLFELNQLDESFKDAKRIFLKDAEAEDEVLDYIDTFKELSSKNIIADRNKDIGYWIKRGWHSFKDFVDENKTKFTKTDIKKRRAVMDSDEIIIEQSENRTIVIPLTMNAACKWGKHTDWCISAVKEENDFFMYLAFDKAVSIVFVTKDFDGNTHRHVAVFSLPFNKFIQFHREAQDEENIPVVDFLQEVNYYADSEVTLKDMREWISEYEREIYRSIELLVNEKKEAIEQNINDIDYIEKAESLMNEGLVDYEWYAMILSKRARYIQQ